MGVKDLPLEVVRERIFYDRDSGLFFWRVDRWRHIKAWTPAGCFRENDGYFCISFKDYGARVLSHRLAWFIETGEWPEEIDHINGDRTDNRWANLRSVSKRVNMQNTKKPASSSPKIGVFWVKARAAWVAAIKVNDRKVQLGQTRDFFEACCMRKAAELKYGFHPNHGLLSRNPDPLVWGHLE